ncbi:hypothetical protein PybrP1_003243 [[Pythium] brassicae (nom. inval.)]|nr:hypothetical protein PybrP1_003243 [[Pythium] brassicae (nom. inval.)]
MTATAKAFFTFNSLALAAVGLAGNGALLVLMVSMKSSSLWFVKLAKSGIYAASCWSSLCAIYRIRTSSSASISLVYIGWLAVAATTVSAVLWRLHQRAERKQREDSAHWAMHRSLLAASDAPARASTLSPTEQAFLATATKRVSAATTTPQATAFARQARTLDPDAPPEELERFMRRARALAAGKRPEVQGPNAAASAAAFMQSARAAARALERVESNNVVVPGSSGNRDPSQWLRHRTAVQSEQ